MICEQTGFLTGAAQTVIVCAAPASFSWVTPCILIFSVCVAIVGIITNRRTASHRATLDFIERFETSDHYRAMRAQFSYYRRNGRMTQLRAPVEQTDRDARTAITDYLNHYEIVAISIGKGALDYRMYSEWMRGIVLRDWLAARTFVQNERWKWHPPAEGVPGRWAYYSRTYRHFEGLARRMDPSIPALTPDSFPPPDAPDDIGDEPLPNPTPTT